MLTWKTRGQGSNIILSRHCGEKCAGVIWCLWLDALLLSQSPHKPTVLKCFRSNPVLPALLLLLQTDLSLLSSSAIVTIPFLPNNAFWLDIQFFLKLKNQKLTKTFAFLTKLFGLFFKPLGLLIYGCSISKWTHFCNGFVSFCTDGCPQSLVLYLAGLHGYQIFGQKASLCVWGFDLSVFCFILNSNPRLEKKFPPSALNDIVGLPKKVIDFPSSKHGCKIY